MRGQILGVYISLNHFDQFEPYLSSHRKVKFFLSMIVYFERVISEPSPKKLQQKFETLSGVMVA